MVFEAQALAPGPGTGSTAAFRAALHSIRWERFTGFSSLRTLVEVVTPRVRGSPDRGARESHSHI